MPEKVERCTERLTIENAKNHLGGEVIPIDDQLPSDPRAPKMVIRGTLETSEGEDVIDLETLGGPKDGKWKELNSKEWPNYKLRR